MKIRYFVSMISLVCLAALGACKGSEPVEANQPPLQTQTQPKAEASVPAPPAELFVTGELQEIDPDAKTLVLKDVQGNELKFAFSPTTKVTGIARDELLSRQEGRNAEIRYVERGNLKSAVLIHIVMGS
jgi:hypothetical protein